MMLKYRGTYRVKYETDKSGKPQEFTYIPCRIKQGTNICRHSYTVLNAYIPSMKIINRLLLDYPDLFTIWQEGDSDGTILFPEQLIDKAAVILKALTKGKDKTAKPRQVYISDERRKILSSRMRQINTSRDYWGKTERKGAKGLS